MTDIKAIHIEFIDHQSQAYETVGNYWLEGTTLQIRVSKMGNAAYECMVAIHEFVEWMTTDFVGIPEPVITEFDKKFEDERTLGMHSNFDEPGFAHDSPYRSQHTLSTAIEMMICAMLGISWTEYDKTVMSL